MDANTISDSTTPMTVGAPITLRLPAGSAVFAVHGEAWITQEGRRDDVILPAGQRFNVPSRAPLVISATRGQAELLVVGPRAARASASCDVHDFVRDRAAQLRRTTASSLTGVLVLRVRYWLRRILATIRPRVRVPTN
jgi:hypothetical protein